MTNTPHHTGHRERLKKRFKQTQGEGFADYELLELILMQFIPRKDVKPIAKDLLLRAGSLPKVMDLTEKELMSIKGIGESTAFAFAALKAFNKSAKRQAVLKKPAFKNKLDLLGYLYDKMTPLKHEEFHVLYLNSKGRLVHEEALFRGTIDGSAVYPREIMRYALDHGASAIVLVHNHPSGDPSPSMDDNHLTEQIRLVARPMGVSVEDHIIIGDGVHYSYKDHGKL